MSKNNLIKKMFIMLLALLIVFNISPIISFASSNDMVRPYGAGDPYITFENKTLIKTITNKFVAYADHLTPDWKYAREYETQSGREVSLSTSVTYNGISSSVSYTFTSGASAYIPADSSRLSKLAYYDDFKLYRESVYENYNGSKKFVKYVYELVRIPGRTKLLVKYYK